MRNPSLYSRLTILVALAAGFISGAGFAATLSGRVLDYGAEEVAGIPGVTVVAFRDKTTEVGRTLADTNGFYTLGSLPIGIDLQVSFERIGYSARPTWKLHHLSGNLTANVNMVRVDAPLPYYDRLADQIAASASPEAAWKVLQQFQLPVAKRAAIESRLGELMGTDAIAAFRRLDSPPSPDELEPTSTPPPL